MVRDWTPCDSGFCLSGKCTKTEIPKGTGKTTKITDENFIVKCEGDDCKEDAELITNNRNKLMREINANVQTTSKPMETGTGANDVSSASCRIYDLRVLHVIISFSVIMITQIVT